MKGTTLPAKVPMRLMPPNTITATRTVKAIPEARVGMPKASCTDPARELHWIISVMPRVSTSMRP